MTKFSTDFQGDLYSLSRLLNEPVDIVWPEIRKILAETGSYPETRTLFQAWDLDKQSLTECIKQTVPESLWNNDLVMSFIRAGEVREGHRCYIRVPTAPRYHPHTQQLPPPSSQRILPALAEEIDRLFTVLNIHLYLIESEETDEVIQKVISIHSLGNCLSIGIPILQALQATGEIVSKDTADILLQIRKERVKAGERMVPHESLTKLWGDEICEKVSQGEEHGTLDTILITEAWRLITALRP